MKRAIENLIILTAVQLILLSCSKEQVRIVDEDASYGGLDGHLKIETPAATYFFRKEGGGFSGVLDRDGIDWIGHSDQDKSAGQWRGIPNTNTVGWRPEQNGSTTKIEVQEKDRVVISCSKNNYKCIWSFYPDRATMTITEADSVYYFTYEGAPNGKFDTTSSYLVRPDLKGKHYLGQATDESDIEAQSGESWEWCYFSDDNTKRALCFIHHEDDTVPDLYRPLDQMTVFGFGRTGAATENLTSIPQSFSIAFCEENSLEAVKNKVTDIMTKM
jgi:hypothetical protein